MNKSVKIRRIIFEILYEIYRNSINFEESFEKITKKISINDQDKSMVYNVVLNSLRNKFYINKILNKYLKKRTSIKIKILLLSAITQLLFLDFKDYAVTNDTVEIAKTKNLNPGLINALLKKLINDKKNINKEEIDQLDIPVWFSKALSKINADAKKIIKDASNEPSLHLVFKSKKFLEDFKEPYVKTTETSAFVKEKKIISRIEDFNKGNWWVQDFSSMLPIFLSPEIGKKSLLDMCAAPGGKAFQSLSLECNVTLNDISIKRIYNLKNNLKRLNFENNVLNLNSLDISEKNKFEVVILDAPCSGIATLRRNPEILYKKKPPDINYLVQKQKKLLNKAAKLLKKRGLLIYMVCSFFYEETKEIKKGFLNTNKNFSQYNFKIKDNKELERFIDVDGDIYSFPDKFKNYMIDGFYAVKFIRND